jgi:hypothetical protein
MTTSAFASSDAHAVTMAWVQSGSATPNAVFDPAPLLGLSGAGSVSIGRLVITTGASLGATVTITYLGQESGFNDSVVRSSTGASLLTESNAAGSNSSFGVAAGLTGAAIDFTFKDSAGGSAVNGSTSGQSRSSIGLIGTNVNLGSYGSFAYVLGFNDSGANHDDWDDFVIGINAADAIAGDPRSVPEPGTLVLFGASIVALGLARRRRTS